MKADADPLHLCLIWPLADIREDQRRISQSGDLCRQDIEGRKAGGFANRTANEI
jgi:hypothetical protein